MKVAKRISVLFLLICGLLAIRGTTAAAFGPLEDCLNACGNTFNGYLDQNEQTYSSCLFGCTQDLDTCGDGVDSQEQWCKDNCDLSWPYGSPGHNACHSDCEELANQDRAACDATYSSCSQGCASSYYSGNYSCSNDAGSCQNLCYQLYP